MRGMIDDELQHRIHEGLWNAHTQISDRYHAAIEAKLREWVEAGFDPSELVVDEYPHSFSTEEYGRDGERTIVFTGRFRIRTRDMPTVPWKEA